MRPGARRGAGEEAAGEPREDGGLLGPARGGGGRGRGVEDEEGGVAPEAEAAEHGEQSGGRGRAEEGGGGRGARGGGEGREPPEDRGAR